MKNEKKRKKTSTKSEEKHMPNHNLQQFILQQIQRRRIRAGELFGRRRHWREIQVRVAEQLLPPVMRLQRTTVMLVAVLRKKRTGSRFHKRRSPGVLCSSGAVSPFQPFAVRLRGRKPVVQETQLQRRQLEAA